MESSKFSSSRDATTHKGPIHPTNLNEAPPADLEVKPEYPKSVVDSPPADMEVKPEDPNSEIESPPSDMEVKPEYAKSEVEGEEEGECGFCIYMKGGGCKEAFIAWEKCVELSEDKKEDIVEKCGQVTAALKKCMEAHTDYYGPLLQAEKDAQEEVDRQLEQEKEKEKREKETTAAQ